MIILFVNIWFLVIIGGILVVEIILFKFNFLGIVILNVLFLIVELGIEKL